MALSPFDHPFLSGLFADPEIAALMSADADIGAMLRFEVALAEAQVDQGVIPETAASHIARLIDFKPDLAALRAGVGQDGVVVAQLVKQLRAQLPAAVAEFVHFGATSQDVIDTSLVMRLASVCDIFDDRLAGLVEDIDQLVARFGTNRLMARTRMQDALEISVADRLIDWRAPLVRHRARLKELRSRLLVVQFGGAVGTLDKFNEAGPAIRTALAERLGLGNGAKSWHSARDGIVEFGNWLALVAGSLGKIGQDAALMAQNAMGDISLASGGGSSAMPHKSNPVAAEVLVSLARYAAGSSGTLAQAMVHEQERSGTAWTLEWLVLPQLILATGSSTLHAGRLLTSINSMGRSETDASH